MTTDLEHLVLLHSRDSRDERVPAVHETFLSDGGLEGVDGDDLAVRLAVHCVGSGEGIEGRVLRSRTAQGEVKEGRYR